MRTSRLDNHDDPPDREDHSYSPEVERVLASADTNLRHGTFAPAIEALLPLQSPTVSMTAMQRLRLLYMLGQAFFETGAQTQAIGCTDTACAYAEAMGALHEYAVLAQLGASSRHAQQHFLEAYYHLGKAVDAFHSATDRQILDPSLELDLLDALATESFLIGRYSEATSHINRARRLLDQLQLREPAPLQRANLDWTAAMVARWNNDHDGALAQALRAYGTYAEWGHPVSLARLRLVIADTLLDTAAPLDTPFVGTGHDHVLDQAAPYVRLALAVLKANDDEAGVGLAHLTASRCAAASGDEHGALWLTMEALKIAQRLQDRPLEGQVWTTRGAVCASFGRQDDAWASFTAAIDVIGASEARAYVRYPYDALVMLKEA